MIWLLLPPCLMLAFLLSGIESALLHVSRVRVRHAAEEGDHLAGRMVPLLEHRTDLLHAAMALNHVVALTAFIACTLGLVRWLGHWGWAAALLALLPAFLVILKFVPKHLFRRYPFRMLRRLGPLLLVLHFLAKPWHWLARATSAADPAGRQSGSGLQSLADTMTQLGVLPPQVCAMVQHFATFQALHAGDIMLRLDQLTALPPELPLTSARALNDRIRHPWRAVLGAEGSILGWLDMTALPGNPPPDRHVRQFMRPLLQLSTGDTALRCLQALRKRNEPVASVVDPRGETVGVITQQGLLRALLAAS